MGEYIVRQTCGSRHARSPERRNGHRDRARDIGKVKVLSACFADALGWSAKRFHHPQVRGAETPSGQPGGQRTCGGTVAQQADCFLAQCEMRQQGFKGGGMKTEAAENGLPVLLVRPEDAARVLGVGRTKVYELIRSGALRSVRVGGLRRIPVTALNEFVTRLEEEAA
jgi:excisionase family DNA binding protein